MPSKMLIDAAHPEETRVVAVKGTRVEEFDYESANKKQLRGNIYLAKVTRVEPSLQAAFVDYGGNRHGFLAFSEIHPDYYQIPVADRQALLEEEAAEQSRASAEEAAEDEAAGRRRRRGRRGRGRHEPRGQKPEVHALPPVELAPVAGPVGLARFEIGEDDEIDTTPREDDSPAVALEPADLVHEISEPAETIEAEMDKLDVDRSAHEDDEDDDHVETVGQPVAVKEGNGDAAPERVESVGSEDALEEVPERARRRRGRPYKIQEVIRRRQIILVQVVKEERGTKGAALTTYLSLAGRYTVLMPNTARGGG
ncbi:MAG: S1 RNA-binding domain-containing protein, partial [Methyloceanibacter sp.]|nr:S1 RNA-binding domain-containing protein [Methyloceanibacter sp.]